MNQIMSDREPYDRHSEFILFGLPIEIAQNDEEIACLKGYDTLYLSYIKERSKSSFSPNVYSDFEISIYEQQLCKLENSKPIQDILHRVRKPKEKIHMSFGHQFVFNFYSILWKFKH
jgi:hypothetical protein